MKKYSLFMLLMILGLDQSRSQCPCCSGSTSGFSGGESSPGLFVLGKKKWMAEMYSEYRSFAGVSKSPQTDRMGAQTTALAINSMDIGIVGIRYGLTNRTSLLLQQPMFLINSSSVNSKTVGDLLWLVNYFPVNKPGLIIGLQAGMEWPTGQIVEISNGTSISTGSGSFDPVAGINVLKPLKNSFFRASGFFKYTTKGFNGTNYGDFFGHQLNYTMFLNKRSNACSIDTVKKSKPVLSVNVQLAGEWSQAQLKDNVFLANTGSYVMLGSVGSTIAFNGFAVPITFSLPLIQNFNGEQNQTKFRLRIGITKTFK
jgi:hypothetical protein